MAISKYRCRSIVSTYTSLAKMDYLNQKEDIYTIKAFSYPKIIQFNLQVEINFQSKYSKMLRMYLGGTNEPYSHCSSHWITVQIHA